MYRTFPYVPSCCSPMTAGCRKTYCPCMRCDYFYHRKPREWIVPMLHNGCTCYKCNPITRHYDRKGKHDDDYEDLEFYTSYELEQNIPRRKRSSFDSKQVEEMELYYRKKCYITFEERVKLSKLLHLDETQIKIWFQNRRAKEKRSRDKVNCDRKVPEKVKDNAKSNLEFTSEARTAAVNVRRSGMEKRTP